MTQSQPKKALRDLVNYGTCSRGSESKKYGPPNNTHLTQGFKRKPLYTTCPLKQRNPTSRRITPIHQSRNERRPCNRNQSQSQWIFSATNLSQQYLPAQKRRHSYKRYVSALNSRHSETALPSPNNEDLSSRGTTALTLDYSSKAASSKIPSCM